MPEDTDKIIAAMLAIYRIARVGTKNSATTRQAYVDEYLKMLDRVQNPNSQEPPD